MRGLSSSLFGEGTGMSLTESRGPEWSAGPGVSLLVGVIALQWYLSQYPGRSILWQGPLFFLRPLVCPNSQVGVARAHTHDCAHPLIAVGC